MKGSRLIVSLAALAWADAAAAQQAGMIQPGSAPGIINEGAASPAGIQVTAPEPVPTDIRPDRDNALDLGTQVTQSGRNYVIDGGARAGSNLFHSFSRFDLGQGDFASWVHSAGNPLTISNVISRVTGGGPSRIFGTMDSTALPNANFFFINPAGIVFGDGAQVNVPAGAHFSTASEVRFAQGPAFTVATPNGSTFSVASPAAFGFVGGEASVRVSGATPNFLPGAGALTLSGADVTVEGSTLTVGSLALAGTGGSPATLALAGTLTSAAPGNVTISGSSITATGEGGITIAGGTVSLADAALSAHSSAGVPSGGIAVRGAQSVSLTTSTLTTTSGAGGSTEQGGEIFLSAPDLLIGDSVIETKAAGSGAAGSLLFQAGRLRIADSNIRSIIEDDATGAAHAIAASEFELLNSAIGAESTSTTGTAGSFDIVADTVRVQDSGIFSYAFNGGRTGDLSLRASRVELGNSLVASQHLGRGGAGSAEIIADSVLMDASRLDSDATEEEDGETGGIRLRANIALLRNGSEISSTTFGSANGGFIDVSVRELELDSSRITANTLAGSSGVGGLVTIASRNLTLRNGSAIQTESAGTGDAGLILISGSNSVTVTGMSEIESDTFGGGDAGLIKIDTSRFELSGNSLINSNSLGSGGAGFIIINARQALIADSGIETSTVEGTGGLIELNIPGTLTMRRASLGATTAGSGNGGQIDVTVGALRMFESIMDSSAFGSGGAGGVNLDVTGDLLLDQESVIRSEAELFSTGNAGRVRVSAGGTLTVTGDSAISSNSRGSGRGGIIQIRADQIRVTAGGEISTDAFDSGRSGFIGLDARNILISGAGGDEGSTFVSSDTIGTGEAGGVFIRADALLQVDSGAFIASDTYGAGAAGEVEAVAGTILVDSGSIRSKAHEGSTGAAGQLDVRAPLITVANQGTITTSTSGTGNAGEVRIGGQRLIVRDGAQISSNTDSSGNAGSVRVGVSDVTVTSGGAISSSTSGGGNAGIIEIVDAARLLVDREGRISSTSVGTGAAGDVLVAGGAVRLDNGAVIESNAGPEAAKAGTVLVLADTLSMANRAAISTSTLGQGPAGQIAVGVDSLTMESNARIASNTGGRCENGCLQTGNAGEIAIQASGTVALAGGSEISSNSISGSGNAGQVFIESGALTMNGGRISTGTAVASTGRSGTVAIATGDLRMEGPSSIETISRNANPAGLIDIEAADVVLQGPLARIASSNEAAGAGDAGSVFIAADNLSLFDGAQINTSSIAGAAGDISLTLPSTAFLKLVSTGIPSVITTSSGPGTGGRIFIGNPFAIISNGGSILALGNQGGANVAISTQYFIRSSDRANRVAVDGDFLLEAVAYDVSAGTVNRDLSVLDASGVLRGQCAAVRQTGQVSQLVVRPIGPYGARPTSAAPDRTRLLTAAELQAACS